MLAPLLSIVAIIFLAFTVLGGVLSLLEGDFAEVLSCMKGNLNMTVEEFNQMANDLSNKVDNA